MDRNRKIALLNELKNKSLHINEFRKSILSEPENNIELLIPQAAIAQIIEFEKKLPEGILSAHTEDYFELNDEGFYTIVECFQNQNGQTFCKNIYRDDNDINCNTCKAIKLPLTNK